jgi:hypothetical protein
VSWHASTEVNDIRRRRRRRQWPKPCGAFTDTPSCTLASLQAKPNELNQSCRLNSEMHRPHDRHNWPGNHAVGGDETRHHANEELSTPPTTQSLSSGATRERQTRCPSPCSGHPQLVRRAPEPPKLRNLTSHGEEPMPSRTNSSASGPPSLWLPR